MADAAPITYKICVQNNPDFSLSIKNGLVVLLQNNDADFSQLWVKTDRSEKDRDQRPTFILVNRLTGEALRSPVNPNADVTLETCNNSKAAKVNDDVLWVQHTTTNEYYYIATKAHSDRVIDAGSAHESITLRIQDDPVSYQQKWQLNTTVVTFGGEFAGTTQYF